MSPKQIFNPNYIISREQIIQISHSNQENTQPKKKGKVMMKM